MIRQIIKKLRNQQGKLTYSHVRAILHHSRFPPINRITTEGCSVTSSASSNHLMTVQKRNSNTGSCYNFNRGFHCSVNHCNPRNVSHPFLRFQGAGNLDKRISKEDNDQRNSEEFGGSKYFEEQKLENFKEINKKENPEETEEGWSYVKSEDPVITRHGGEYDADISDMERGISQTKVFRNKERTAQKSARLDLNKMKVEKSHIEIDDDSFMSSEITQKMDVLDKERQVHEIANLDLSMVETQNVSFTEQFMNLEKKRRSLEKKAWGNERIVQETTDLIPANTGHVKEAVSRNEYGIEQVVFPTLYNLAPLVQESEILQKMVALGVDLSKIEKCGLATKVIHMEFERDILPFIMVFNDVGIPAEKLGFIINKCPDILKMNVRHIEVRINYLKCKKIKPENIAMAIERKPHFLCLNTRDLDARLGQYQKLFHLTGRDIRENLHKLCYLLPKHEDHIVDMKYFLKKDMQFSDDEIRQIAVLEPKVLLKSHLKVYHAFNYCTNVMGVSRDLIFSYPYIFMVSENRLKFRHQYMLRCGLAQYDPTKENYVGLQPLITVPDHVFAVEIAKSSLVEYTNFLKTI